MIAGDSTVTIHRRTSDSVDDYGNVIYATEQIVVDRVLIALGSTASMEEVARLAIDSGLTLYMPHGTVILEDDLFEVNGDMWEKDGDSEPWDTVNAFEVGVVVKLRRRRG